MKDRCNHCNLEIRPSEAFCPACNNPVGFPNVRAARQPTEIQALEHHLRGAQREAKTGGYEDVLQRFTDAVRSSKAVICRGISKVKVLLENANELYASFYDLVSAGGLRPEDTEMDRLRRHTDSLLFPYYEKRIRFAALSLDGKGASSWENCALVLKDDLIRDRANVFEENSVHFCHKRVKDFGKLPPGCRAAWEERHSLAAAKLGSRLKPTTEAADFPDILLSSTGDDYGEDFVEVHIGGSLHRHSVERLVASGPM